MSTTPADFDDTALVPRTAATCSVNPTDVTQAARLVAWGLRPTERPASSIEYRELIERYQRDAAFQDTVKRVAAGLECRVLYGGPHGLLLAPSNDSPFELTPSAFRGNADANGRLLDGLIQVAIASTVYPRAADMLEDPGIARSEITASGVMLTLDTIAARLRESAQGAPDPDASAVEQGLVEAWRVYDKLPRIGAGSDGRVRTNTVRRQIDLNLDRLREFGCMMRQQRAMGEDGWRPTYRYQVLVQDYAYGPIMDALARLAAFPEHITSPTGDAPADLAPSPDRRPRRNDSRQDA